MQYIIKKKKGVRLVVKQKEGVELVGTVYLSEHGRWWGLHNYPLPENT